MRKGKSIKRIAAAILCTVLILCSLACVLGVRWLQGLLSSQKAAERWAGEGEDAYRQVSCFLQESEGLDLNRIYAFRYAILDRLREAGIEADTDTLLFRDAWSLSGKVYVSSDLGHGEVSAIAVGGDFFLFHPLRLLSGSYLAESDLMQDCVLLDEETAWLLFGGTELEGMEIKLDGIPFRVAGVVRREEDFASKKAYTAGRGIYLSYDAYRALHEEAGATCYELVLAEPIQDFSLSFVKEKFPIGQGVIVENTQRFSFGRALGLVKQFGERSMQTHGVIYPYWENAARCVEDWCSLLSFLALLFALFPALLILSLLLRFLKRGKNKLTGEIWPSLRDKLGEAVNRQQRKRWEKKHPGET